MLIPETLAKPVKGKIAYIKDNQLYQVNTDRTAVTTLTSDATQKSNLIVSPDGSILVYTSTVSDAKPPTHGLSSYTFKSKKVEVLLDTKESIHQNLSFSSSGRYLSAWNNNGQEAIVLDVPNKQIVLRYSTDDQSGMSPISWIPNSEALSFVLKSELFTGTIEGQDLKVLSKDVVGVKTDNGNVDIPVTLIWSDNGKYVSYLKKNGLYYYDLDSQTETPVVSVAKDFELDKIPYQAVGFTKDAAHLLYQSIPDQSGKKYFCLLP